MNFNITATLFILGCISVTPDAGAAGPRHLSSAGSSLTSHRVTVPGDREGSGERIARSPMDLDGDYHEIAEGVWAKQIDGEQIEQVIFGEVGHRWLTEQLDEELLDLYEQAEERPSDRSVPSRIELVEARLLDVALIDWDSEDPHKSTPTGDSGSCSWTLSAKKMSGGNKGAEAHAKVTCSSYSYFNEYSQACASGKCSYAYWNGYTYKVTALYMYADAWAYGTSSCSAYASNYIGGVTKYVKYSGPACY